MTQSAICARINRLIGVNGQGSGHQDCIGDIRYLDVETGDYVEEKCGCECHVEKREWYLSDFGPPPHEILLINDRQESQTESSVECQGIVRSKHDGQS